MTTRPRTPCEHRAVGREYARLASRYDKRWASYINSTVGETLKRLHLKSSDRLLDIGCGTGSLLKAIAAEFPTVDLVGVDLSAEMLQFARRKLGNSAVLIAGTARSLPLPSASFDVVVLCSAFHYFRRPKLGLLEIKRVLQPGGRIVITDWCNDYISCRLLDAFLRLFNPAHFKAYSRNQCKRLLEEAGFGDVQVERYKISWLWGLMTAKARAPAG